jgi:hypothetical protein
MIDQSKVDEYILASTRQQLAQAMAVNAELSALLQIAQDKVSELEELTVKVESQKVDKPSTV